MYTSIVRSQVAIRLRCLCGLDPALISRLDECIPRGSLLQRFRASSSLQEQVRCGHCLQQRSALHLMITALISGPEALGANESRTSLHLGNQQL